MKYAISEKTLIAAAWYFLDNSTTIRDTAEQFGISRTTLWHSFINRLPKINNLIYLEVRKLLDYNKKMGPIRGGMSTKAKFMMNN